MPNRALLPRLLGLVAFAWLTLGAAAQNRLPLAVTAASNESQVSLHGTVLAKAKAAVDLGPASEDRRIDTLSLRFNMTEAQTTALNQLLQDQQNPRSSRYHQWLTPEQFGAAFGLSQV